MLTIARKMSTVTPAKIVSQKTYQIGGINQTATSLIVSSADVATKANSTSRSMCSTYKRTIPSLRMALSVSLLVA